MNSIAAGYLRTGRTGDVNTVLAEAAAAPTGYRREVQYSNIAQQYGLDPDRALVDYLDMDMLKRFGQPQGQPAPIRQGNASDRFSGTTPRGLKRITRSRIDPIRIGLTWAAASTRWTRSGSSCAIAAVRASTAQSASGSASIQLS